ncbi:uncharacterized protein [Sinocyclocheilus grahami]|uniref:uncharacterized protein n=1 Tax=Sinocyclocheilus grahami TaxID=75366 RepID=UPI0007ACE50D|nr:PREDICTED: uncharacterized protein LOC107573168 [Sinocyclocheilus grahami]
MLYIAPLQMELDTTALPPESESFNDMSKEKCQKCGITYPLVILTALWKFNKATCPICQNEMPLDVIEIHASFCTGDSTPPLEFNASMEEPSTSAFSVPVTHTGDHSNAAEATSMSYDWKTEPDKNKAASLYTKEIICQHEMRKPLLMTMDLRMVKEDQDRELVAFYKQNGIEWASPVKCRRQGDAAIGEGVTRHFLSTVIQRLQHGFNFNMGNTARTCLFDGEPGHLVPSSSQFLVE